MTNTTKAVDRNVDGILHRMRDYVSVREQQAVRINPRIANIITDIGWVQLENLRQILQKPKAFGGEKHRVADVLAGVDDLKRKALLSSSDQNSITHEIINRSDETQKRVADVAIHDMRTLFRAIDPSLENIVQLLQHWVLWDLPDAADLFHFDEQVRRLVALRGMELNDDIRGRYRQALQKMTDDTISDSEVLNFELRRLEIILVRFLTRRSEEEPYQMIIRRDTSTDGEGTGEPYDYKKAQANEIRERFDAEKSQVDSHSQPALAVSEPIVE